MKLTDKVYLGDVKGPFRIVKIGHLLGEKAVAVIKSADYADYNKYGVNGVEIARWIPIADLVKDEGRRGWRERWRQTDIFTGE